MPRQGPRIGRGWHHTFGAPRRSISMTLPLHIQQEISAIALRQDSDDTDDCRSLSLALILAISRLFAVMTSDVADNAGMPQRLMTEIDFGAGAIALTHNMLFQSNSLAAAAFHAHQSYASQLTIIYSRSATIGRHKRRRRCLLFTRKWIFGKAPPAIGLSFHYYFADICRK